MMSAMRQVRVKMCGLFREQDIICVNAIKPSHIGFVFAPSPRQVSIKQASALKAMLHADICAVGVFTSIDIRHIIELVEARIIDAIQLHDVLIEFSMNEESIIDASDVSDASYARDMYVFKMRERRILELKKHTNVPIIKAIAARSSKAILIEEQSIADMLLLDNVRGGSGERFCWEYITKAREDGFCREFFLAGGICAANIKEALELKPYGLDMSKGIESNGIKDCHKMREIMHILAHSI